MRSFPTVPTVEREARAPTATYLAATWTAKLPRTASRDGFTLLELLVVLTLVGLLTAVVAIRLEQPYRAARLSDVAQRIVFADQQTRSHARRFEQNSELVCDLDKNLITVEAGAGDPPLSQLAIPSGVRLERVRTTQGNVGSGQVRIAVAADGQTPSYAVWLKGAEKARQGLFFAGLTGQVTRLEAESDEESLFRLLSQAGIDAH